MSSEQSIYRNRVCFLASMHEKERAVAPAFEEILGCKIQAVPINTDRFGTFSGEVERICSPLECARRKCLEVFALQEGGICLASEGSFFSDPSLAFCPVNQELLLFFDREKEIECFVSRRFFSSNYASTICENFDAALAFARQIGFPSHGVILRPEDGKDPKEIRKGITDLEELFVAFRRCSEKSSDRKVRVESDMRAHKNPTRMSNIRELAKELAVRLTRFCPECLLPGWGIIGTKPGLPCSVCYSPTELPDSFVYGCCTCSYREVVRSERGASDPGDCPCCNP